MERIRLTKPEKAVLRGIALGLVYPPDGVSQAAWVSALRSLQRQGFVKAAFVEGGNVEDAQITDDGRALLESNPSLRNPIDWKWVVTTALVALGVLISICGLLVSCFCYTRLVAG